MMNPKNIYVNPSFIPKSQPKIYVNPSFVNSFQREFNNTKSNVASSEEREQYVDKNIMPFSIVPKNIQPTNNIVLNKKPKTYFKPTSKKLTSVLPVPEKQILAPTPLLSSAQGATKHAEKFVHGKTSSKLYKYYSDVPKPVIPSNYKTKLDYIHSQKSLPINKVLPQKYNNLVYKRKSLVTHPTNVKRTKFSIDNREIKSYNRVKTNYTTTKSPHENHGSPKTTNKCSKMEIKGESKLQEKIQSAKLIPSKDFEAGKPLTENLKEKKDPNFASALVQEKDSNHKYSKELDQKTSMSITNLKSNISSTNSPVRTLKGNRYSLNSKLKLIRSGYIEKKMGKSPLAKDNFGKKNIYSVKTKTKLIRRTSTGSKLKSPTSPKLRRASILRKGLLLQARENMLKKHYRRSSAQHYFSKQNKYKLINKPKETLKNSRYRLTRNNSAKQSSYSHKLSNIHTSRQDLSHKAKRHHKKSDKFINIEGNLYKSTRTSLKKQDIESKKRKSNIQTSTPKLKSKKFLNSNSKFVYRRQNSLNLQSGTLIEIVRRKKLAHFKRINDFCFFFNKYGKCNKENKGCPFIHDPSRIAICTRFLQGSCPVKDCPFTHTTDKSRMPVCSHFLEGACHRETCPYRHVRVNPKAPVCTHFLNGHCPQGEECKKKHILVCEEFKKSGVCPRGRRCFLSHRKAPEKTPSRRRLSSSQKRRKKRPAKKSAKIGILGLEEARKEGAKGASSKESRRYFSCAEEGEEGPSWGSGPLAPALAQKRHRLLSKIEKMKRNYHLGSTEVDSEGDGAVSGAPPLIQIGEDDSATVEGEEKCSMAPSDTQLTLPFLPLPDSLPSFIPLCWPGTENSTPTS